MEYFPKKSGFFGKVSPVESRGGTSSKKNDQQIFLSEDPSTCCPVESGRGTLDLMNKDDGTSSFGGKKETVKNKARVVYEVPP